MTSSSGETLGRYRMDTQYRYRVSARVLRRLRDARTLNLLYPTAIIEFLPFHPLCDPRNRCVSSMSSSCPSFGLHICGDLSDKRELHRAARENPDSPNDERQAVLRRKIQHSILTRRSAAPNNGHIPESLNFLSNECATSVSMPSRFLGRN